MIFKFWVLMQILDNFPQTLRLNPNSRLNNQNILYDQVFFLREHNRWPIPIHTTIENVYTLTSGGKTFFITKCNCYSKLLLLLLSMQPLTALKKKCFHCSSISDEISFLYLFDNFFFRSYSNIKKCDYILVIIDENSIVQYFIVEF